MADADKKRLKIIQWGMGGVGKLTLRELLKNPQFEVIAVKAFTPEKAGKDAGEELGGLRNGLAIVTDVADLPLDRADCVMYCPRMADYDEVARLLRAGVNVVTPASNVYPLAYGPEIFNKINDAGIAGNASFHGSGINPAFISDVLALTFSGVVHQATRITVREVSDIGVYAAQAPEIVLEHTSFGKDPTTVSGPDHFLAGMDAYFGESIRMICDHLGVALDRIEHHHDWATTNVAVTLSNGTVIEPGTIGCRRFEYRGIVGGQVRIVLSTSWKVSSDLTPAWDVSTTGMVEWTITVEGTPSFQSKVMTAASFDPKSPHYMRGSEEAALVATAVHGINAIPAVCAAPPGVRTFLDLPIIGSQGAFRLPPPSPLPP